MNTGAPSHAALAPLEKQVTVPGAPLRAFELFVDRIADWWPLATHSVNGDRAISVQIEGRVGGHIKEISDDATEDVWGTLTSWDPPAGLAFTWHPGQSEDRATAVELTFRASGDATVVTLIHSGWAQRADGVAARRSYDTGWTAVLDRFADGLSQPKQPVRGDPS
ncbi:MAG: SRPBCC domain-containing protein [Nocardioides sp.]